MKTSSFASIRSQHGIASVEFALVLPLLILLFAFTVFFCRLAWHYEVALKAASDAATVMALARKAEIGVNKADLDEIEIVKLSKAVATAELSELRPGAGGKAVVSINCDGYQCIGDKVPAEISVLVRMKMIDIDLTSYTAGIIGPDGLWLYAEVRMPYAGF